MPLNGENVKDVAKLLVECLGNGQPYVVFDLQNVPLIDSAGLELLLDFTEQFRELGGALKLAAPSPLCRDILSITGLGGSVEIFRDALAAAGSFAR
ncbi:MAG: hypothetical protein A2V70_05260 [Planctomycetes bacterium RBG_13_63_9]|nr:MAG: hypothetical protein A2V70_05260 [Planctomycetes bacterium RBG_13_63_9]